MPPLYFRIEFDFSGLLCTLIAMFCMAISALGIIIGLFIRHRAIQKNPNRLPLARTVIVSSIITILIGGLSLLLIYISRKHYLKSGVHFRGLMDTLSLPVGLLMLAVSTYLIFRSARSCAQSMDS